MFRAALKSVGILLLIAVLGITVLLGIQYFRYRTSPEYRTLVDVKNLEKKYAEDPYGGETPEETLRLFIDALKKGDTDLAAKYFILDKQQGWREDLAKIKDKNLLDEMVKDLERAELTKEEETAFLTLTDENNVVLSELVMHKNPQNNRWKITEL